MLGQAWEMCALNPQLVQWTSVVNFELDSFDLNGFSLSLRVEDFFLISLLIRQSSLNSSSTFCLLLAELSTVSHCLHQRIVCSVVTYMAIAAKTVESSGKS